MKYLLIVSLVIANSVQAVVIKSATYDSRTNELVMDIEHGGCNVQSFQLHVGNCMESHPYQVSIELDDTKDICESFGRTTIRRSLRALKCRPASATLTTRVSPTEEIHLYIP